MFNLSAIYWIKNEARYIPEWIEFHLLQGYDHFILYDNKSTDDLLETVKPYIDVGLLEIRHYPPDLREAKNYWLAKECCAEQRGKSKWIDFRSIDERVFSPVGAQIPDFLNAFEDFGGVAVAWEEFNFNGHKTRPEGLLIENYTQTCADLGHHIKTIVQPEHAIQFNYNPHNFVYRNDKFTITEQRVRIDGAHCHNAYSFNRIKAHHYNTLSEEEFNIKMNKGGLDHGLALENIRREQAERIWVYMHGEDPEYGKTIFGFNEELMKWVQPVRNAILKRYKDLEHLLPRINH